MSATDIFFLSAITHPHPTAKRHPCTSGTTRGTREINERIKNPFFSDPGLLRDFFHELYLTLSITPLVSTSDGAGMLLQNHDFEWFSRGF